MTTPTKPLLARLRTPRPGEVVAVELVGTVHAVTAIARALASVAVVTGMEHRPTTEAAIRLRVTCHPVQRVSGGGGR
jgi:hypothetical protein